MLGQEINKFLKRRSKNPNNQTEQPKKYEFDSFMKTPPNETFLLLLPEGGQKTHARAEIELQSSTQPHSSLIANTSLPQSW